MSGCAGTIMLRNVVVRGSRLWVMVGLATLGVAGCGNGDIGGGPGGGGTSGGQAGVSGAAGTGSSTGTAGTGSSTGAGGTNGGGAGTGSSAGTAGTGASTGAAGTGSATGAAGTGGGAAGTGIAGAPKGVDVTSRDLAVDGKGTVFNNAENYFNDGFVPATPVANFGTHAPIITAVRDDGSLDVAWLDYVNGKGQPWAVRTPGAINVTHIDPALTTATTTATGLTTYKLLGFARDDAGALYFTYNKDHALKSTAQGNQNNLNGNELHVAKQATLGTTTWDTLLFGNQDNNAEATKGDPGGAASGVLGYDPTNKKVVLYVGHSMMWMPTRHQAGFLRLLDPTSGAVIQPAGNDVIHFGSGWFYSHNFNQRLLIDGGDYYVLAHGDAYARQLGLAKWSLKNYTGKNGTDFDESYWTITGNQGDNNTNAQTGQFVRTKDGRFLMVHTTSQGRAARDVRLVLADGATGKAATAGAVWLTTNKAGVHATISKVELLGDAALVTYALWDSTKKHQLDWYAALLDPASLAVIMPAKALTGVEFIDSAPLFRFKGGPNAGRVGWVSGNAAHTLSVHVASPTN
jgi:hypothetical protein